MQDRESQRLIALAAPLLAGTAAPDPRESSTYGSITIDQVRSALAGALSADGQGVVVTEAANAAANRAITLAQSAVDAARVGDTGARLSAEQRSSLEAIVCVTGRPSMRYLRGMVQQPIGDATANARWLLMLGTFRDDVNRRSESVGRVGVVTAGGVLPLGTAWRASEDLVVTNKHVVSYLIANARAAVSGWKLDPTKQAVVEFGCSDESSDRLTSTVAEFVFCKESETADLGLLRIKADHALPAPLPIEWSIDMLGRSVDATFRGRDVYVVGHPYAETATAVAAAIFMRADGSKRCAPGQVTMLSASGPAFEHDCSTLAGNSGSCIFTADTHRVVGLHVGGRGTNNQTGLAQGNVAVAMGRLSKGQFADLVMS